MASSFNIVNFRIPVPVEPGFITAEAYEPDNSFAVLTLGHGAGTNMNHASMKDLAGALSKEGVTTIRFNFAYTERNKKMPDRAPVTTACLIELFKEVKQRYGHMPIFGGGRSFGGRMTSTMQATNPLDFLEGIIFYGFPLHPADQPATDRAAHLQQVTIPLLFLSGTADTLAYTDLLKGVCDSLPNSKLMLLEGADHSFQKAKAKNLQLLSSYTVDWLKSQLNG
jgi:predicted alpha/beta-hydrolase family hydrolase